MHGDFTEVSWPSGLHNQHSSRALGQISHMYWYTRLEIAQYLSHLPSMSSRGLSSVAPCTRSSIASQHSTRSARALQHVAT